MHTLPIWILDFIFTVADELPNLVLYCVQFTEGINFDYIVFNRVACQTYERKELLIKLLIKTNYESSFNQIRIITRRYFKLCK